VSGQFSAVSAAQIDVVIDYLWGHSAELLLPALANIRRHRCAWQWVPGWRRYRVKWRGCVPPPPLMGSGIGSLTVPQLLAATGEMLQAAVPEIDHRHHPRPLQEIAALAAGRQPKHGFHPRIKNRFRTKDGVDILNEKYYLSHH
jgi:hypothetical protein